MRATCSLATRWSRLSRSRTSQSRPLRGSPIQAANGLPNVPCALFAAARMGVTNGRPKDLSGAIALLGPIESFEAEVFLGDGRCPQTVCDFVAALALVFNDLRNLSIVVELLQHQKPSDTPGLAAPRGDRWP